MPNRILREGILTSKRIAQLNWAEEVLYRRIMSIVDDFGRHFADPGMLHAACYPRQLTKVSDSDIGKWLQSIEAAGLASLYLGPDGDTYLQLLDFRQQTRAKHSKFPDPPSCCAADAMQPHCEGMAHAHLDVVGDVVVIEDGKSAPRKRGSSPKTPLPDGFAISEPVRRWSATKGHANLEDHLESFIRKCQAKDYRYVDWDKAFMNAIAEDWGKVREQAGKAKAVAIASGAKPAERGPTFLEILTRDAKTVGLKMGDEESTQHFRLRVDEAMQLAEAH